MFTLGLVSQMPVPSPPSSYVLPGLTCCCFRQSVDIQDAYKLLSPTLGAKAASIIFALALLASGQNSTITGTLAGQVVCEGARQQTPQDGCGSGTLTVAWPVSRSKIACPVHLVQAGQAGSPRHLALVEKSMCQPPEINTVVCLSGLGHSRVPVKRRIVSD